VSGALPHRIGPVYGVAPKSKALDWGLP